MDNAGTAAAGPGGPASATDSPGHARTAGPTWRFLITPRWLAWHAFAVAAFWGMFWLGDWQLHRALAGNALSWAYTFEWPIFALMGAVFWAKTIRDEFRSAAAKWPTTPAAGARSARRADGPRRDYYTGSTSGEIEIYDPSSPPITRTWPGSTARPRATAEPLHEISQEVAPVRGTVLRYRVMAYITGVVLVICASSASRCRSPGIPRWSTSSAPCTASCT